MLAGERGVWGYDGTKWEEVQGGGREFGGKCKGNGKWERNGRKMGQ